jgi:hypothetical protein
VKVRQNDLIKNKNLLQNVNQKYRKTNLSSSSLLRMFSVYWGSTQVKLAEGKRSIDINQSSVADSVK